MDASTKKNESFCKQDLLARGWTQGAIAKFLGEPDSTKNNTRGAYPVKLYCVNRVVEAEESSAYKNWLQQTIASRKKKSDRALHAAQEKRRELIAYIDNLKIEVPRMSVKKLRRCTANSYNEQKKAFNLARGNWDDCTQITADDVSGGFGARIVLNYIRHNFNNYDDELERLAGKTGKDDAYQLLKNRIATHAKEAYPIIADWEKGQ